MLFLMCISIVQSGWLGLKVDINHFEETERDLFDCSICPTVCNRLYHDLFYLFIFVLLLLLLNSLFEIDRLAPMSG